MTRQYELLGASGARYRYLPLEEDRFLPSQAANYVIARVSKDGSASVIYAGETDNLANQNWRDTLAKARSDYPGAKILTRLNVTRAIREAERNDLVEQHHPPMNR